MFEPKMNQKLVFFLMTFFFLVFTILTNTTSFQKNAILEKRSHYNQPQVTAFFYSKLSQNNNNIYYKNSLTHNDLLIMSGKGAYILASSPNIVATVSKKKFFNSSIEEYLSVYQLEIGKTRKIYTKRIQEIKDFIGTKESSPELLMAITSEAISDQLSFVICDVDAKCISISPRTDVITPFKISLHTPRTLMAITFDNLDKLNFLIYETKPNRLVLYNTSQLKISGKSIELNLKVFGEYLDLYPNLRPGIKLGKSPDGHLLAILYQVNELQPAMNLAIYNFDSRNLKNINVGLFEPNIFLQFTWINNTDLFLRLPYRVALNGILDNYEVCALNYELPEMCKRQSDFFVYNFN